MVMDERPLLAEGLDDDLFMRYYYSKKEMMDFCRQVGLSTRGSKYDLIIRIGLYLDMGFKTNLVANRPVGCIPDKITLETRIEENIVCSQKHRAFFKEVIGPSFTFIVPFQEWLREHAGSTYAEAVSEWYELKKKKIRDIPGQCEYNAYIHDFFQHNPGRSMKEAIQCWNFKKMCPDDREYSSEDLWVLSDKAVDPDEDFY